jgi:hypothetical protein
MAERRYLRAQAALAAGDLAAVEPILSGITSARANALRAAVTAARAGYPVPEADEDTRDAAAWRQGDWQDLSTSDDPLLADATALVLSDTAPAVDADASLAESRALLSEAEDVRAVVEALLDRYPTVEDDNLTN